MKPIRPILPPETSRPLSSGAARRVRPFRWTSLATTYLVGTLLYLAASLAYPGFLSWEVFVNLLADNAFLGVASVGMTFVILSGGIDLSVGAMIGCGSILIAHWLRQDGATPVIVLPAVLLLGTGFGAGMGALIRWFELPPFLVTLAGMFLARGAGLVVSMESIPVEQPDLVRAAGLTVFLPVTAWVLLGSFAAASILERWTPFGRTVYAVGGSATSALLMGLPVGRVTVGVYALSGFCSSLAGVVYAIYTLSGNASAGAGLELDAIAAAVIGGTLLSGGVGTVTGTFIGVLILGVIQTALTYQGTLSSWWTRIAIGLLLLAFILLQRLLQSRLDR